MSQPHTSKPPCTDREWLYTLIAPVFVIGNGPLSRPLELPEEGSVIRFNNFVESDWAGHRTTHWVTSGYSNIEVKDFEFCFVPVDPFSLPKSKNTLLDFEARFGRPVIYTFGNEHVFRHFPGAKRTWRMLPTTGFSLLAWLWSKGITPKIAGFNGLAGGHHSNPNHKHGHAKTAAREWALIRSRCEFI